MAPASTPRFTWLPWLVLAVNLAVGTVIKLACTHDQLVLAELGVPGCYSDVVGIFQARGLAADPLPYVEVTTEYPPLTALQWWLAMALSSNGLGFLGITATIAVVATAVQLWILRRLDLPLDRQLLFAAAPTVLLATLVNWDPVAVALLLGGVLAHVRGRDGLTGVLAGLGMLAKAFPVVLVVILGVGLWGTDRRRALVTAVSAGLTIGVGTVVAWAWAGEGLWAMVETNRARSADWDTLWFLARQVTGVVVPPEVLNVLVVLALLVGWVLIGVRGRHAEPQERWRLILPVLVWFVLAGKVYSPQYSLWLLPLVVLLVGDRRLVWAFLLSDAAVFLTRFPFLAGLDGADPSLPYWPFGLAVAVRAGVLILVMASVLPHSARVPSDRRAEAGTSPPPDRGSGLP